MCLSQRCASDLGPCNERNLVPRLVVFLKSLFASILERDIPVAVWDLMGGCGLRYAATRPIASFDECVCDGYFAGLGMQFAIP